MDKFHGIPTLDNSVTSSIVPLVEYTNPPVTEINKTSGIQNELLPSPIPSAADGEELPIRIATFIPENNVVRSVIR